MSQEGKDEKAALEEFMEVFKSEDKKLEKEQRKEFIKGFRTGYKHILKVSETLEVGSARLKAAMELIIKQIYSSMKMSTLAKAEILGRALGQYFSLIELMIKFQKLNWYPKIVLDKNKGIVHALHEAGIKPRKEQIRKRLQKIARKHRGDLDVGETRTLAAMANQFVS